MKVYKEESNIKLTDYELLVDKYSGNVYLRVDEEEGMVLVWKSENSSMKKRTIYNPHDFHLEPFRGKITLEQ